MSGGMPLIRMALENEANDMSKDNHSAAGNSAVDPDEEFVSDDRCGARLYDLAKREIDRLASDMPAGASGATGPEPLKKYQDLIRETGAFVSVALFWGRSGTEGSEDIRR